MTGCPCKYIWFPLVLLNTWGVVSRLGSGRRLLNRRLHAKFGQCCCPLRDVGAGEKGPVFTSASRSSSTRVAPPWSWAALAHCPAEEPSEAEELWQPRGLRGCGRLEPSPGPLRLSWHVSAELLMGIFCRSAGLLQVRVRHLVSQMVIYFLTFMLVLLG